MATKRVDRKIKVPNPQFAVYWSKDFRCLTFCAKEGNFVTLFFSLYFFGNY